MKWIVLFSLLLTANVQNTSAGFDTYCNGRFGFCIDYPTFLTPQEEAQNGDGRSFTDKAGKKVLLAYGRLNQDMDGNPIALKKQYALDIQELKSRKSNITYQKLGSNFYVVSGEKNDEIFYQKMIRKEDAYCYSLLTYSKAEKNVYDYVSVRMFKSFR